MSKVPDDILLQLGRLTVGFANLEIFLRLILWNLAGPDHQTTLILTSDTSFAQHVKTLRALAQVRIPDDEKLQRLEDILRRASQIEERRNSLVHSFYAVDDNQKVTRLKMSAKSKRGFSVAEEKITAGEIAKFCDEINATVDAIKAHLGPSSFTVSVPVSS